MFIGRCRFRVRPDRPCSLFLYLPYRPIDHRLKMVMKLCERIQAPVFGEMIDEDTPEKIQNNPDVKKAYLGG